MGPALRRERTFKFLFEIDHILGACALTENDLARECFRKSGNQFSDKKHEETKT